MALGKHTAAIEQKRGQITIGDYPHIAMLDEHCVVCDIDGVWRRYHDTFRGRAIIALNPQELREPAFSNTIAEDTFKRMFCDIDRLENSRATRKRPRNPEGKSLLKGSDLQSIFFPGIAIDHNGDIDKHFKGYLAQPNDRARKAFLEKWYDELAAPLLADPQTHIKKAKQLIHTKGEEAYAHTDEAKRRDLSAITTKRRELFDVVLNEQQIDPDFLEVLNGYGGYIFIAGNAKRTGHLPTDIAQANFENGGIYVAANKMALPFHFYEELVHQVDNILQFSKQPHWHKALDHDMASDRAFKKEFMNRVNDTRNKASIFNVLSSYKASEQKLEALPDFHYVNTQFEAIWQTWEKTRNKNPRMKSFLKRLENDFGANKEAIMQGLFPETYVEYQAFLEQVHEKAAPLREARLAEQAAFSEHIRLIGTGAAGGLPGH
jgi:hypothetical protein